MGPAAAPGRLRQARQPPHRSMSKLRDPGGDDRGRLARLGRALVRRGRVRPDRRGRQVRLVLTWSGLFGTSMAGDVLLPGAAVRIAPTTFDEWLAAGAAP